MTVLKNGHLKIKGRYPSGNYSFVIGATPSDCKWKLRSRTLLRRFINKEILQTQY
ncbi:hypothetical protein SynPROS71_02709 [Synechococcus sp. PROS-7-1]|nr:hypothetical protein SynPROS71_02709 [Synechococcus sp. PROS-7-1]